ncbi:GIY-YIG nuclease family protein [Azohydromonas aeria]|uniref:GIY-YIG nuclease family protein n=1 Tax=Azohydromonas aeria TaxID=2590212 RepID=UPI0012F7CFBB|nr:GIY-YIG nuclease family protein [Azohydromonas aeria]
MSRERHPAVYIVASRRMGTLYVGVTSDLIQRAWHHRQKLVDGFASRYGVRRLVYYEQHATMGAAITREKQIKWWRRAWKIELIETSNPEWKDLWPSILGTGER